MSVFRMWKQDRDGQRRLIRFGDDHAVGFFVQVWGDNDDEPDYDKDAMFDGLTPQQAAQDLWDGFGIQVEAFIL